MVLSLRVHSLTSLELTLAVGAETVQASFVDGRFYLRGNAAYLVARFGPRGAALADRWFTAPTSIGRSLLGPVALRTFARCLTENHGTLSFARAETVSGEPAVVLRDEGDVPGSQPRTLAVASDGPPWPLQIVTTGSQRPGGRLDVCNDGKGHANDGVITLSDFDAVRPIVPPLAPVRLPSTG